MQRRNVIIYSKWHSFELHEHVQPCNLYVRRIAILLRLLCYLHCTLASCIDKYSCHMTQCYIFLFSTNNVSDFCCRWLKFAEQNCTVLNYIFRNCSIKWIFKKKAFWMRFPWVWRLLLQWCGCYFYIPSILDFLVDLLGQVYHWSNTGAALVLVCPVQWHQQWRKSTVLFIETLTTLYYFLFYF